MLSIKEGQAWGCRQEVLNAIMALVHALRTARSLQHQARFPVDSTDPLFVCLAARFPRKYVPTRALDGGAIPFEKG